MQTRSTKCTRLVRKLSFVLPPFLHIYECFMPCDHVHEIDANPTVIVETIGSHEAGRAERFSPTPKCFYLNVIAVLIHHTHCVLVSILLNHDCPHFLPIICRLESSHLLAQAVGQRVASLTNHSTKRYSEQVTLSHCSPLCNCARTVLVLDIATRPFVRIYRVIAGMSSPTSAGDIVTPLLVWQ